MVNAVVTTTVCTPSGPTDKRATLRSPGGGQAIPEPGVHRHRPQPRGGHGGSPQIRRPQRGEALSIVLPFTPVYRKSSKLTKSCGWTFPGHGIGAPSRMGDGGRGKGLMLYL